MCFDSAGTVWITRDKHVPVDLFYNIVWIALNQVICIINDEKQEIHIKWAHFQ